MSAKLTLHQLRLLSGYRQQDVADELGVSIQSVNAWEKGKFRPSKDKIEELAKLYEVSYDEILASLPEKENDLWKSEIGALEGSLKHSREQRQIVESLLERSIRSYFKV